MAPSAATKAFRWSLHDDRIVRGKPRGHPPATSGAASPPGTKPFAGVKFGRVAASKDG